MNKKIAQAVFATGTTLFLSGAPALANDWNGPSIGIGGGYAMANSPFTASQSLGPFTTSESGHASGVDGFFTLGAGYDRNLWGPYVVGAFVDYDFSDVDTHLTSAVLGFDGGKFSLDNQLSIGARFGYLVAPSTLFFGTVGYAHSDGGDLTDAFGLIGARASLGDFNGYFIGGGVEALVYDHFSIKAEYRYTSMQSEDAIFTDVGPVPLTETVKPQIQTVRLSLNYKFGDGTKEQAADPSPPITTSWTGPYLGIGGGYGIANSKTTISEDAGPILGPISLSSDNGNEGGFLAFSAGYDWQIRPRFVVGIFGDADFSNLHYSEGIQMSDGIDTIGGTVRSNFKNILMVGGRVGYLTTPATLLFVSGGYANVGLGDTDLNCSCSVLLADPLNASTRLFGSKRFSGAFAGAGVETKIWDQLSLKAEYRYIDLLSENMTLLPDSEPEINEFIHAKMDPVIQMGRVSLNWRFSGTPLGNNN
jgi:outer membrane immunogenic protein